MQTKIGKIREASNRDKVKEKFEEASRRAHQEQKAFAILKFETSLQSMLQRTLKVAVIKTLADVKKPIFHDRMLKYAKSDGSFRSISNFSIDNQSTTSLPKSPTKIGKRKKPLTVVHHLDRTTTTKYMRYQSYV